MPKVLEDCVEALQREGYPESRAWPICAKKTGWVPAKGGGWTKKKDGTHHSGGSASGGKKKN